MSGLQIRSISSGRNGGPGLGRHAGDMAEEQLLAGQLDSVSDAHVADIPAGPRGADRLHHRLLSADRLDHRVRAEAASEILDACHALVAALGDDLGGAELAGELLAGWWRLIAMIRSAPSRWAARSSEQA